MSSVEFAHMDVSNMHKIPDVSDDILCIVGFASSLMFFARQIGAIGVIITWSPILFRVILANE